MHMRHKNIKKYNKTKSPRNVQHKLREEQDSQKKPIALGGKHNKSTQKNQSHKNETPQVKTIGARQVIKANFTIKSEETSKPTRSTVKHK